MMRLKRAASEWIANRYWPSFVKGSCCSRHLIYRGTPPRIWPRRCSCCCTKNTPTWNAWKICCRSEEHTSELQSRQYLVCRLLLEKKNKKQKTKRRHREHRVWILGSKSSSG